MKHNLLKYGLVLVLALFASIGLLWADGYVELVHDTTIIPCENETILVQCHECDNLDSLVQNNIYLHNTISPKESKDPTCWYVKLLKHIKEYKLEYMLLILLFAFVINIFLPYDKKKKNLIKWILLVAIIAALSNSSWCYLVLMALLLLLFSEGNESLIDQIGKMIGKLYGKSIDTDSLTNKQTDKKILKEVNMMMGANGQSVIKDKPTSQNGTNSTTLQERMSRVKNLSEYLKENINNTRESEEKIFSMLQQRYSNIKINCAIDINGNREILDGLVQNDDENIIFEVLYTSVPVNIFTISKLESLKKVQRYIQMHTQKETPIYVYVVTNNEENKQKTISESDSYRRAHMDIGYIDYKIYSYDELVNIDKDSHGLTTSYEEFMKGVDWDELNLMEKIALFDAAHGELNEKGLPFAVKAIEGSEDVKLSYIDSPVALRLKEEDKKNFPKWLEDTYMNREDGYSYLGFLEAMEKDD